MEILPQLHKRLVPNDFEVPIGALDCEMENGLQKYAFPKQRNGSGWDLMIQLRQLLRLMMMPHIAYMERSGPCNFPNNRRPQVANQLIGSKSTEREFYEL